MKTARTVEEAFSVFERMGHTLPDVLEHPDINGRCRACGATFWVLYSGDDTFRALGECNSYTCEDFQVLQILAVMARD